MAAPRIPKLRECFTCNASIGGHITANLLTLFDRHHDGHDVRRTDPEESSP